MLYKGLSTRNEYYGNLAPGSDTKDAPWNQPDPPTESVNVYVSQTLSKDYDDVESEYYVDSMGDHQHENLEDDFTDNDCYTPLDLIEILKGVAERKYKEALTSQGDNSSYMNQRYWKNVMENCEGWTDDETIIGEH